MPAEEEQLLRQGRATLSCARDPLHLGVVGAELLRKELRVRRHDGQQVVEVVRHPTRQSAHRLHLLRDAQPLLQRAALPLRLHGRGRVADRLHAQAPALEGEFRRAHVRSEAGPVLAAVLVPPRLGGPELGRAQPGQLLERVLVELHGRAVRVLHQARLHVVDDHRVGRGGDQVAVAGL